LPSRSSLEQLEEGHEDVRLVGVHDGLKLGQRALEGRGEKCRRGAGAGRRLATRMRKCGATLAPEQGRGAGQGGSCRSGRGGSDTHSGFGGGKRERFQRQQLRGKCFTGGQARRAARPWRSHPGPHHTAPHRTGHPTCSAAPMPPCICICCSLWISDTVAKKRRQ
jgi:hypothetical protein